MNTNKSKRNFVNALALLTLATLVTGCAYFEYRRVYTIESTLSAEQRTAIGAVIENHFVDSGYTLKRKYHDYHPDDAYVSVLEIPRTSAQKVRDPNLFVLVRTTNVQLKHSEWYLYPMLLGDSKNIPDDIVSDAKAELIAKIKKQLGIVVDIKLFEKSPN